MPVSALLFLLLFACAHPAPQAPAPTGTPIQIWKLSERCDTWWLAPATYCKGALDMIHDGCRWRCIATPIEELRQ